MEIEPLKVTVEIKKLQELIREAQEGMMAAVPFNPDNSKMLKDAYELRGSKLGYISMMLKQIVPY